MTLGIALLYVVMARIGQAVALPPGNITPVWLPSGIMFALALLWGPRVAPGVFLGAFLGNIWAYFSVESAPVALGAIAAGTSNGLGDVLATVGMAMLYRRVSGSRPYFERVRDLALFVALGALVGGLVSAAFGVGGLWATGFIETTNAPGALLTWWTGDGMGVLVLTPLLLVWSQGPPPSSSRIRRGAAALVVLAAGITPAVLFGLIDLPTPVQLTLAATTPLLLWAALELGRHISYLVLVEVSLVTLLATAIGHGPFQGHGVALPLPHPSAGELVSLQLFLAILSITILLLSVLSTQRARAQAALRLANQRLERLSRTDALTELPNRLHTQEALEAALHRSLRHDEPLTVLMVDIDHFKRVNDTWGHNTGDEVLRMLAGALRDGVRAGDLAGRWGGEEFLVLLERCEEDEGAGVAETLRDRVRALVHPTVGRVKVSIGVAAARAGDAPVSLVDRADQALYAAKAAGRDRVHCASDLLDPGPTLT